MSWGLRTPRFRDEEGGAGPESGISGRDGEGSEGPRESFVLMRRRPGQGRSARFQAGGAKVQKC